MTVLARSGLDNNVPPFLLTKRAKGEVRWQIRISVFDDDIRRLFSDMLLDPFEDIRQGAHTLLQMNFTSHVARDQIAESSQQRVRRSLPSRDIASAAMGDWIETFRRAQSRMIKSGRVVSHCFLVKEHSRIAALIIMYRMMPMRLLDCARSGLMYQAISCNPRWSLRRQTLTYLRPLLGSLAI